MKIIMRDGRAFEGTATEIVHEMQHGGPAGGISFIDPNLTMDEYIDLVVKQAREFAGAELRVVGDSTAERALSLLQEMNRMGLSGVPRERP
jgi:hypothetical protein